MANEELVQRGYLSSKKLRGDPFGHFEELNIGHTSIDELKKAGVACTAPKTITFPFSLYKVPKHPGSAKPDRVFLRRDGAELSPVAAGENKAPSKLGSNREVTKASEQVLFTAAALGVPIGITTNGEKYRYINVKASLDKQELVYFDERRDLNPGVLYNLLRGDAGVLKDPKPLAETVWQLIWHATKAEPKECLLTFVELFVLKFLSDNLPTSELPEAYRFYSLTIDPAKFLKKYGKTAIEYYVDLIRPQIKKLFPDNVVARDPELPQLFGLGTIVSKTSIINGFAFLKSSEQPIGVFNRTFLELLTAFQNFGPLTAIDPEFKLRLYETFLRESARQQKLGQFFTPRNVVRQMIRMADLAKLPTGAIVLDPAAGVGGFILEPLLFPDALPNNIRFERGRPIRRVRTVGVDVDPNLHILAKANMLVHLAEAVRDPLTTVDALNQAMAETFVLMNSHATLGSLENPPRNAVDVILTNPPYVTQGSAIYKKEIGELEGQRNGLDLKDYFDGCGLGLESLFLRYISGSLKPGGRAFVIVPLGMLNRTEPRHKQKLLDECDIIGSIQLPRNTFFNTSQKTYILALERRHTAADIRPKVFCAIVRSTGETLDWRRTPTPENNDLEAVAKLFLAFRQKGGTVAKGNPLVKIAPAEEFSANDRWDVTRFWTDEELVKLGEKNFPITPVDFIDEATESIAEISSELANAKTELTALRQHPTVEVSLSNGELSTSVPVIE